MSEKVAHFDLMSEGYSHEIEEILDDSYEREGGGNDYKDEDENYVYEIEKK